MLVLGGFILSVVASTAYSQSTLSPGCKADRLRPKSCFYYSLKGFCTDKRFSAFMKLQCSSMCGYCCPDGTLSQLPFNRGCNGTLNPGCKADRFSPNFCFGHLLKGFCTDKRSSASMKFHCSSMCGYCCPDGTLSQLPFNRGCKDLECAKIDRLPLLTNVTIKRTCLQYYNSVPFDSSNHWVKYYCETTFGWCCMDKKTFADGERQKGCPYKLCYNIHSDEYCLNQTQTNSRYCVSPQTSTKCAWTCKNCKAKSPITCGAFGCCWNGVSATRRDHRDCPPCRDISKHVCHQFKHACLPTGQYRLRNFALTRCPRTCNLCA